MTEEIFPIVNEQDEVIGSAPRSQAHQKGLWHRSVHVVFITPEKNLILQRRSATKDNYPNHLTITVGGHVKYGSTYEETALQEAKEETGQDITLNDLIPVTKMHYNEHDLSTGAHEVEWIMVYAYLFTGDIATLKIEGEEGLGFILYPITNMISGIKNRDEKFTPSLLDERYYLPLYPKFLELLEHTT